MKKGRLRCAACHEYDRAIMRSNFGNTKLSLHFYQMIQLYQYESCPFCEKVRRKLAQLNLEYEKIEVDRSKKPQVVIDLGGTVPVIDDHGIVMNESDDIVAYLEEKYGKK